MPSSLTIFFFVDAGWSPSIRPRGGECSPEWPGQQHRYHESGLGDLWWVERGGALKKG